MRFGEKRQTGGLGHRNAERGGKDTEKNLPTIQRQRKGKEKDRERGRES